MEPSRFWLSFCSAWIFITLEYIGIVLWGPVEKILGTWLLLRNMNWFLETDQILNIRVLKMNCCRVFEFMIINLLQSWKYITGRKLIEFENKVLWSFQVSFYISRRLLFHRHHSENVNIHFGKQSSQHLSSVCYIHSNICRHSILFPVQFWSHQMINQHQITYLSIDSTVRGFSRNKSVPSMISNNFPRFLNFIL